MYCRGSSFVGAGSPQEMSGAAWRTVHAGGLWNLLYVSYEIDGLRSDEVRLTDGICKRVTADMAAPSFCMRFFTDFPYISSAIYSPESAKYS